MRPRNVLTETNNMRKLMGLPLLKEEGGQTIDDIKKKVLNESTIEYEDDQWLVIDKEEDKEEDKDEVNENAPAFSLGFGNQGGLTISEESEHDCKKTHPDQSHPEWEESNLEETTQAKEFEDEGVDENGDDIIEEYDGDMGGELGGSPGIDVDAAEAIGDGEDGLGEPADDQVVSEQGTNGNSFAKYNIT